MNEYPKWITAPGNRRMIVQSAEQERAVMETPYYDEDHLSPEARGLVAFAGLPADEQPFAGLPEAFQPSGGDYSQKRRRGKK